jgi:rhomboid protease GluP
LTALAHRLGPAASAWVTLAAGVLGNALTALAHRSGFISVGASTAVFGALGALAGAQIASHSAPGAGSQRGRARAWVSLAASAALLGLLGTGQRADLLAHLFGMLCGLGLGLFAALALRAPPRRSALQPLLAAATVPALAACWWLALR